MRKINVFSQFASGAGCRDNFRAHAVEDTFLTIRFLAKFAFAYAARAT